jgi:hypothetical protein
MSGVTGEQLYDELCRAAGAAGKSLSALVAPLFNGSSWKIEQIRIAQAPKPQTIARVRALIAGEPLPEGYASARKGRREDHRRNTDGDHRMSGDEIARRRALTDLARAKQRPGEPLDLAVKRLGGGD